MRPRFDLVAKLGVRVPIVQGAFGGFASQSLTAAVSNAGGLGSFGAHGLAPGAIREVIAEIRSLTDRPFAINLWVSMEDEEAFASGPQAFDRGLAAIAGHLDRLGTPRPTFEPYRPMRFGDQARVLLDERVPVFSFIFGAPPREILDECRARGIVTIGGATTPDEARFLEDAGVDVVVASGFEAGGHRGSFLLPAEESLTGTMALVPQVVDEVSLPVIAAGGIADRRGVAAAFALGANGAQVGTAFLACRGSGASEVHRRAILAGGAGRTGLTRAFTGRLARGVRNRLMDELNAPNVEVLPYPLQRGLVRNLTQAAAAACETDLLQLWAGQSANLTHLEDPTALLRELEAGLP